MHDGAATLEDSLAVSQKGDTVTIWSSNSTPGYIPTRNENYIHTETCAWMFTAAWFTTVRNVDTTQMPTNWWVNKWKVACPYKGTLLGNKKQWSPGTCYNMDKFWKHSQWKMPVIDHIVDDSTYMKCLESVSIEKVYLTQIYKERLMGA